MTALYKVTAAIRRPLVFLNLQSLLLLDIEEVLVCINCKFSAGFFVTCDDGSIVHLKSAAGPLLGNAALNYCSHGSCLVVAGDENENFLGISNCSDTNGSCLSRNCLGIVSEESGVNDSRICCKVSYTCS